MSDTLPTRPKTDQPSPPAPAPSWMDRIGEFRLLGYVQKWRERIWTHPVTGLPLEPAPRTLDDDALSIERLAFSTGEGLRLMLKIFPPVCFAVFCVALLMGEGLFARILLSCSVAGLIGYGTNFIAIKMLFRPRHTRPVFGQGLIPSQRDELLAKVADEVIEKLINERIIKQELDDSRLISRLTEATVGEIRRLVHDPEFVRDTKQLVLSYAARVARSETFREELIGEMEERVQRVAGRSFATWLVKRLRGLWREPLIRLIDTELEALPTTLDRLVGEVDDALNYIPAYLLTKQEAIDAALTRIVMSLIREMDVRAIILKQLSTVTPADLEQGFLEFADDKLSYITLLGGLLGVVGGLVIVSPVYSMLGLVALGSLLTVVDILLFRFLRRRRERRQREPSPLE